MNKKILSLLLFAAIKSTAFTQSLNLADLVKLNSGNLDNIDTYAIQKGFEFDGNRTYPASKGTFYTCSKETKNKYPYCSLNIFVYDGSGKREIVYQTGDSKVYLSIKKDLSAQKFTLTSSEDVGTTTKKFRYTNGKMNLTLETNADTIDGQKLTIYNFTISDK